MKIEKCGECGEEIVHATLTNGSRAALSVSPTGPPATLFVLRGTSSALQAVSLARLNATDVIWKIHRCPKRSILYTSDGADGP